MRYHCIQCSDTGYHNLSIDNVTRPISMLKISRNLFCSITIRQKLSPDQFPLDLISKLVKSHRSNEFSFFMFLYCLGEQKDQLNSTVMLFFSLCFPLCCWWVYQTLYTVNFHINYACGIEKILQNVFLPLTLRTATIHIKCTRKLIKRQYTAPKCLLKYIPLFTPWT